jgi:hypothetical protein
MYAAADGPSSIIEYSCTTKFGIAPSRWAEAAMSTGPRKSTMEFENEVDVSTGGFACCSHSLGDFMHQLRERHVSGHHRDRIELYCGKSLIHPLAYLGCDRFRPEITEDQQMQTYAVPAVAAEQIPDRRLIMLPFDVPQDDVYRTHRCAK